MVNKKFLINKVLTTVLIAIMMTTVAAPAMAANGDFYDSLTKTPYYAADYRTNATTFNALLTALDARPDKFVFENGGKGYNYANMLNAIISGTTAGKTVTDAFIAAKADPVNADVLPTNVVIVSSINSVKVTTTAGKAPVLPTTVTATMNNGTTESVAVTWASVSASQYATSGSFTVSGKIASSSIAATANVTVLTGSTSDTSLTEFKQQLFDALEDRQTNFTINYLGKNSIEISSIIEEVSAQDDYLEYTLKGWQCSYSGNSYVLSVSYRENKDQSNFVTKTVNGIIANIITPGMNVHQKEKAIHDYIVLHVAYDQSLTKYTAYDALTSGEAVCQGYALLTYKMLSSAGIENKIVEGDAGGGGHAWNLINLDGNWYHLDVTWDDPIPDKPGRFLYNYYDLADTEIAKNHSWTKTYPAAKTSYFQTLNQLTQSNPNSGYQDLIKDLGLHS